MSHIVKIGITFQVVLAYTLILLTSPVQAQTTNSNIIPNEFIVKFKPTADPRLHRQSPDLIELKSIEDEAGVVSARALSSLDNTYIYRTDGTLNRQATLQAFNNTDAVLSIEPDRLLSLLDVPNDPDFNKQWALNKINANGAWDSSHGSDQVVVAVIDSGCEASHSDLAANITETKVFDDPQFINDHGTHVCGIIGGIGNNNLGIAGVNWNIGIMVLKADAMVNGQHGLRMSKVADAISYATQNGARIINLSLGGSASDVLKNAIDEAEAQGVLVVAAAGNNASQNYNLFPAAWPNVVSVSATAPDDTLAFYSSFGKVDLAAPGGTISQDRNGDGKRNKDDCIESECIYSTSLQSKYSLQAGTSMAAPHVSGIAALLIAAKPQITRSALLAALESSADDLGTNGKDIQFGHGRVNATKALQSIGVGGVPTQPPVSPSPDTDSTDDGSSSHPCIMQAEKGDYNCDTTTNMNDYQSWKQDFIANLKYASLMFFEELRAALLN